MQFDEGAKLYSYEIKREEGEDILYFNYLGATYVPSISGDPLVMERIIDALIQNPNVSRIVLVQQNNYNYDFEEVSILIEIANLYTHLVKQERIISVEKLGSLREDIFTKRYNFISFLLRFLKRDPVFVYRELKRALIEEKIRLKKEQAESFDGYVNILENFFGLLEKTKLIQKIKNSISEYAKGDRAIYYSVFRPDVIPNFAYTRLVFDIPRDAEMVDQYKISNGEYDASLVTILRKKDEPKLIYHLIPPENYLTEDQSMLLGLARKVLIEHQPKAEEFTDTEKIRRVFFNISRDLLRDLAQARNVSLEYNELNTLSMILVRHTIGFGLIEVLLQDRNLQDIFLNAPIPRTNVFVRHQDYDECVTNILPSQEDVDSWAAKFRMISGRPLDEANPILDTQLEIENLRARIAIIQRPLSPDGISYAIRRHRENPWTLPLFLQKKMLNPLASGILSFLVDGSRTLLVAGTRSSGKTSVLGSLMLEIIPKYRMVVIEDSLELPVESIRKLGYDVVRMKVRSALLKTTSELSADDGIRTSLRLGDSSLIVGEVRSVEAKALYEAMRVGALANVVAGTIHGASPYAVFDRVVNDLGVPATSFKATDVIIVANPIKTADGLHSWKRLVQVSEVRKHWKKDPQEERGFVDLLKYNVEKDILEPTPDLINGDSEVIKSVAANVKGWAGNWDEVYNNIMLRAKVKEEILKIAEKTKDYNLLEAEFNTRSNNAFHVISDKVTKEVGLPISERVFPEWQKWLNREVKKRKV